ncbi:hypothetical protein BRADI_1g16960v3 [Brachypodium distachyon]|uniref:Uncharacterized protein n=1 Tax=Brachypodium distachyon TaxID=15368 RepID=A0A0Q3GVS7_BRADI|nr:hypothetical protein BRADI_1g16960v3 [Brachypodium distachyon]
MDGRDRSGEAHRRVRVPATETGGSAARAGRRGGAPASGRDGEMAGDDGAAWRRRGRGRRGLGRRGSAPRTGRAGGAVGGRRRGHGRGGAGTLQRRGRDGKTRGGAARPGGDGARSGTAGSAPRTKMGGGASTAPARNRGSPAARLDGETRGKERGGRGGYKGVLGHENGRPEEEIAAAGARGRRPEFARMTGGAFLRGRRS